MPVRFSDGVCTQRLPGLNTPSSCSRCGTPQRIWFYSLEGNTETVSPCRFAMSAGASEGHKRRNPGQAKAKCFAIRRGMVEWRHSLKKEKNQNNMKQKPAFSTRLVCPPGLSFAHLFVSPLHTSSQAQRVSGSLEAACRDGDIARDRWKNLREEGVNQR